MTHEEREQMARKLARDVYEAYPRIRKSVEELIYNLARSELAAVEREARAKALEEAAELCDQRAHWNLRGPDGDGLSKESANCAEVIRGLKDDNPNG